MWLTRTSRNRLLKFGATITLLRKRMKSSCVRKGAWSGEEDLLLRKCIETYGQGKWHLVPQRAGLNRCRKSCRLRWLNYLQPNLKREEFKDDEIDLIMKMHKLLGNRWSLIAGRIPGRTANDIKNYWNSHLSKKAGLKKNESPPPPLKRKRDEVIRPQPRSFKEKILSERLIDVNITKMPQQQEEERQLRILIPSEGHNMWLNKLLLEDDEDSRPSSCVSLKNERLLKDYTQKIDLQRVQFGGGAFEWDDLLISDDWLVKY